MFICCIFKDNVTFYKTERHSEDIKGKGILLGKAERDFTQFIVSMLLLPKHSSPRVRQNNFHLIYLNTVY